MAIALPASLVLAAALVHSGPGPAVALVVLAFAAVVLIPHPYWGLWAAVVLTFALPTWWAVGTAQAGLFRVTSLLALLPLLIAPSRMRWRVPDVILLAFVTDAIVSAVLQTSAPHLSRFLINLFLPVAFYVAARAMPLRLHSRVLALATGAITVGAITVIAERLAGHVLFQNSLSYDWLASVGGVFRPGGIYGNPPAAGFAVVAGLLFNASLWGAATPRARLMLRGSTAVMLVALALTFERSAMIALAAGAVIFLLLTRRDARTLTRYGTAIGLITIVVVFAFPALSSNSTFQNGILRKTAGNTWTARTQIWSQDLSVVTSSVPIAVRGVGFASATLVGQGGRVPPALAFSPLLWTNSIHSQYFLILLEQGIIGLVTFLAFVGLVARSGIRFTLKTGDRLAAGMVAFVAAFALQSVTSTPMLDTSSWILALLVLGLLVSRAGQVRAQPQHELARTQWRARGEQPSFPAVTP